MKRNRTLLSDNQCSSFFLVVSISLFTSSDLSNYCPNLNFEIEMKWKTYLQILTKCTRAKCKRASNDCLDKTLIDNLLLLTFLYALYAMIYAILENKWQKHFWDLLQTTGIPPILIPKNRNKQNKKENYVDYIS